MTFRDIKHMSGEFVEPTLDCETITLPVPQPDNSGLAFHGNETFLGLESPGFGLSSTQLSPYVTNQNFNPNNWLALHFDAVPLNNSPFLNYNLSLPFQGVNPLISPSLDLTSRNASLISPNLIQPYNTPALPFLSPSVMGSGLDFLSPNYLVLFDSNDGYPENQRYTAPTDILNTPKPTLDVLPFNNYPPNDHQNLPFNTLTGEPSPQFQVNYPIMDGFSALEGQFIDTADIPVPPLPPSAQNEFQTPAMFPVPFPTPVTGLDSSLQSQIDALIPTLGNCIDPSMQLVDMNEPLIPSHMDNVHSFITSPRNDTEDMCSFHKPYLSEPLIFPEPNLTEDDQPLEFPETLSLPDSKDSGTSTPATKRANDNSDKQDRLKRPKPAISVFNVKATNPQRILPYSEAHATQSLEAPETKESKPKRRYVCDFPGCGLTFSRLYNSKTHCETHYPDRVKAHPCPECSRRFDRKHDLGRHLQTVHRKERKHICDSCGKNFSRGDALVRHVGTPDCVVNP